MAVTRAIKEMTALCVCIGIALLPQQAVAQSRCDAGRYIWSGQMGYIKACLTNAGAVRVKTALTLQIAGPNAQQREISDHMNVMMMFNIPTQEGG